MEFKRTLHYCEKKFQENWKSKIFDFLFNKLEPSLKIALSGYKNQIDSAKIFKASKDYQAAIIKYSTIKKILSLSSSTISSTTLSTSLSLYSQLLNFLEIQKLHF